MRSFVLVLVSLFVITPAFCQDHVQKPDTVTFMSGSLKLKGLLWKPLGSERFPAIMYSHGSELHPEKYLEKISKGFVERGYLFFVPFRRGQGLSIDQGKYIGSELDSAGEAGGPAARFALIMKLHETTQLQDQMAALEFLKQSQAVDPHRLGVVGMSFGGIQTLLLAGRTVGIKAALNFASAAMMWEKSPEVAAWMTKMVSDIKIPVYFIQAENDFSIKPSMVLSEEMKRLGKPYAVKIYPPRGDTPMKGHTFIDEVDTWGPDVFPQLQLWLNKP